MKRIKSLCIVLVLALFAAYVPVQAAKQDDTMIKMQQKDAGQVELALYPNGDMIKNHATTYRIQMKITEIEISVILPLLSQKRYRTNAGSGNIFMKMVSWISIFHHRIRFLIRPGMCRSVPYQALRKVKCFRHPSCQKVLCLLTRVIK